jgi:hypothetical protein
MNKTSLDPKIIKRPRYLNSKSVKQAKNKQLRMYSYVTLGISVMLGIAYMLNLQSLLGLRSNTALIDPNDIQWQPVETDREIASQTQVKTNLNNWANLVQNTNTLKVEDLSIYKLQNNDKGYILDQNLQSVLMGDGLGSVILGLRPICSISQGDGDFREVLLGELKKADIQNIKFEIKRTKDGYHSKSFVIYNPGLVQLVINKIYPQHRHLSAEEFMKNDFYKASSFTMGQLFGYTSQDIDMFAKEENTKIFPKTKSPYECYTGNSVETIEERWFVRTYNHTDKLSTTQRQICDVAQEYINEKVI